MNKLVRCAVVSLALLSFLTSILISFSSSAQSVSLKLNKDQILSVITPQLIPGKESASQNYQASVFPIAQKHGFKTQALLKVEEVLFGEYNPPVVALYSWPNAASEQAFNNEPQWPALKSTRTNIWKELKITDATLTRQHNIQFDPNKSYTIGFAWVNPNHPEDYQRYLGATEQALKKAGGKKILVLKDNVFQSLASGIYAPAQVTFVEWDSKNDYQKYLQSDAFRAYGHYFQSGISRFEWYRVSPIMEGEPDEQQASMGQEEQDDRESVLVSKS